MPPKHKREDLCDNVKEEKQECHKMQKSVFALKIWLQEQDELNL